MPKTTTPSATPRRQVVASRAPKTSQTAIESDIKTPVRNLKRGRQPTAAYGHADSVEEEFYRIFSDNATRSTKRKTDNDLSFLFRGPTNHIGTSTVGMYGEIAHSSLKQVCRKMIEFGLDDKSVVLDLGSGRGVPNFVFATDANTFSSIGIEKCPIAYLNSINNVYISLSRDIKLIRDRLDAADKLRDDSADAENYATSTPSTLGSLEDVYDLSVNTQLEEDDAVYTEYSKTPTRFAEPQKSALDLGASWVQAGLAEFKTASPTLPVAFVNEDIIAYDSFEGVTHFYSFDIAMERALINNMVYQFKNTSTAYVFASFISDLITSFELTDCFVGAKVPCKMYGSGEGKRCYVYVKNDWRRIKARADAALKRAFAPEAADATPAPLDVNNYDEPYSSLDIIRLSKMPLYYQYAWYLQRLGAFYKPLVTRSQSRAVVERDRLAAERDRLIEQIAHGGSRDSQEGRRKLRRHIATHYRRTRAFPGDD